MEKTYIIGKAEILKSFDNFSDHPILKNDIEIHDWIVNFLKKNEVEKLLIEISHHNPKSSMDIVLHLRLAIDQLREKCLIPILLISQNSLDTIIEQTEERSHILSTKGVYFSELGDLESLSNQIRLIEGLTKYNYLTNFLKSIIIHPEDIGRHSIANLWGAYAMDKAAKTNSLTYEFEERKKLYFKYISAFNNLNKLVPTLKNIKGSVNLSSPNLINSKDKKILLIDDEADKGWETVLINLFETTKKNDFIIINEKVKDYNSFSNESKKIIENNEFDLYLLDLRLNGLEEDDEKDPRKFSGMNVLKKIKELNDGNQVIVFTASNKVWNLKALLDKGADSYYLKESPEFRFSNKLSEMNYDEFKENVQSCFSRVYLREIYPYWKNAFESATNKQDKFIRESDSMLDIAWNLLSQEQRDFGYLTLFQILELYADKVYNPNTNTLYVNGQYIYMIESKAEAEVWKLKFNKSEHFRYFKPTEETKEKDKYKPTTLFKVSCLLRFCLNFDSNQLLQFGRLNKLRNDIAHEGAKDVVDSTYIIHLLKIIEDIRKIN